MIGMHLNEYLYYYYYAEQALQAIKAQAQTRGEEILELNTRLIEQLEEIGVERDPERALRAFFGYEHRRGATYMHYAHGGTGLTEADRQPIFDASNEDAGIFDAEIPPKPARAMPAWHWGSSRRWSTGHPLYTALNVPNQGAIPGMLDEDVVEGELPGGWQRRAPPAGWRCARPPVGPDAGAQAVRAPDSPDYP